MNQLTRPSTKVNRTFHDVVSEQQHLQYKCELAAAGLLDNPNAPGALFDRRKSSHKCRLRFDDLNPIGNSSLPLGETVFCYGCEVSGDIHAIYTPSANTFHFCRPPSVSDSRPMKTWSFPVPFEPEYFAIHPPLDLIVITDNV